MYNQPDEEFDRLCREAAENPEGHPSTDGWDKLRRKLDMEMPEKPDRRPGWLLWLPFLISLPLAMLYWTWYPASGKNLSSSLSVLQPAPVRIKKENGSEKDITSTNTRNNSRMPEAATAETSEDAPGAPAAASTGRSPVAQQSPGKESKAQERSFTDGDEQVHRTHPVKRKPLSTGKTESAVQARATGSAFHDTAKETAAGEGENQSGVAEQAEKTFNRNPAGDSSVLADTMDSTVQADTKKIATPTAAAAADSTAGGQSVEAAPAPVANDRGVGFMAVFGPDFSNVHFASGSQSGFSLGMLFEFHFNKRLSLQTGMIYEKKNYTAMGDDYGKIPGYDVNNPNFRMEKVDAHCFMWEVPINLRYNLLSGRQHRVFAAGGLSTYLMRKEDLHYYYSYNNVSKYKNWMNNRSSAYWFAVANLSIGYEYRINQLISIQAEPYFKIPVKGMGYGSVPINSLGMLFGIRYRPMNSVDQPKK